VTVVSARRDVLEPLSQLTVALAGLRTLAFADDAVEDPSRSRLVFTSGEAYVDLAGLVDRDAEIERLRRELANAEREVARAESKLANQQFVDRAPAEVVQRERDKLDEWRAVVEKLRAQLAEHGDEPAA
jgi:valyl-tRNA synthetase